MYIGIHAYASTCVDKNAYTYTLYRYMYTGQPVRGLGSWGHGVMNTRAQYMPVHVCVHGAMPGVNTVAEGKGQPTTTASPTLWGKGSQP